MFIDLLISLEIFYSAFEILLGIFVTSLAIFYCPFFISSNDNWIFFSSSTMLSLTYFWWPVIFVIISCEIVLEIFYCPSITLFFDFMISSWIYAHLVINSSYFALMLSSTAIEAVDAASIFCVLLFWLATIASLD